MSSWEYSQPAAHIGIETTRECWPGRICDSSFRSSCIVQQPIMRGTDCVLPLAFENLDCEGGGAGAAAACGDESDFASDNE